MTINSIYEKPTGVKGVNEDWITNATPITEAGTLIIQVAISTAVTVEVTLDDTNYDFINNGDALVANTLHRFEIDVDNTMTFNIRAPAGTTITQCLIKEVPVAFAN